MYKAALCPQDTATVLLFDYNKRPFETVGHVTTCQMRNMLPELHVCDFFEMEKIFF